METLENFSIFQEAEFSYISINGNPEKLIFQEVTLRAQKIERSHS